MRAWPVVQSSSEAQLLGQVDWQTPPQHRGVLAVPLQSESPVHALGQEVACKQMPAFALALRLGSRPPALVQQISPAAWSHVESAVQVAGQSLAAVQNGVV
jgi:hypothetical protein